MGFIERLRPVLGFIGSVTSGDVNPDWINRLFQLSIELVAPISLSVIGGMEDSFHVYDYAIADRTYGSKFCN